MSVLIWHLSSDGINTRSKSWKPKLEAKVIRIQGGWASREHGINGKKIH